MAGYIFGSVLFAVAFVSVLVWSAFEDRAAGWLDAVKGLITDTSEALRRAGLRRLLKLLVGLVGLGFGGYLGYHWLLDWVMFKAVICWMLLSFVVSSSLTCLRRAIDDGPLFYFSKSGDLFDWAERRDGRVD